ncbi:hypothetical protein AURDEDRAFT_177053 [Auricularia subglabra TFB-10046 SS5]|uniref:Uncharacterized protein n=1 Tax=Auricularia subglabra (strain TFB-10046 / SS5) TaxID=717982 RepID=J0D544_AURST|nr:hypothetical protein AURDEDRAFT_177053 [Auricularia subglabra TFB-10046 SS5]
MQQPPQSLCGPPSSLAFLPPPSRPPLSSPSPLLSLAAADADFDSSSGCSAALSTCSLDDAFDNREHLLSLARGPRATADCLCQLRRLTTEVC